MTRSVANRTEWRDEQGALLVLTATLMPVIVAIAAITFGITSLWTTHDDLQRAADIGATVAAANVPVANLDPDNAYLPFPIEGMVVSALPEGTIPDLSNFTEYACPVALGDVTGEGSAAVTNAFKRAAITSDNCDAKWLWEHPTLAAIAACLTNLLDVNNCAANLRTELGNRLPALNDADAIVQQLTADTTKLVNDNLVLAKGTIDDTVATLLASACTAYAETIPGQPVCLQTVSDLLTGSINAAGTSLTDTTDTATGTVTGTTDPITGTVTETTDPITGTVTETTDPITGTVIDTTDGLVGSLPTLPSASPSEDCPWTNGVPTACVWLERFLPAALTPRVEVRMHDINVRPSFSPFTFRAGSTAVARRTIKSALVLPTVVPAVQLEKHFGLTVCEQDFSINNPDCEQQMLTHSQDLRASLSLGDSVIDPNEYTRAARDNYLPLREDALDQVTSLTGSVAPAIYEAYALACATSGQACPALPDIDTTVPTRGLTDQFAQDLWDATRPPPQGAQGNSLNDVLDYYANSADPVAIVTGLQSLDLEGFFGDTIWSVLTDPRINPALAPLLTPLMYIPALDVVPATIGKVVVPDPYSGEPLTYYEIQPIRDTLAAKGLFQSRLVK